MTPVDVALLLTLAALWGGSFLFIRIAVPAFGPATLVALRVAIAAVLLWAFARLRRRPVALRPYAGRLAILGLLNAALPYVLISAAELRLTASFAAVLNATIPLFAAPMAARWLGEPLGSRRVLGLLAGVVGVAVMVGWSPVALTSETGLAVAAMLAASVSYAASPIYARAALRDVPAHTLALGQQLGALAWLVVPGIALTPRVAPSAAAAWSLLALAVLSTAVAYLLFFRLLERVGATKTATLAYLLPVTGLAWGVLFLDEPVTVGMLVGLGMVLGSVVMVNGLSIGGPLRAARFWRRGVAVRLK